MLQGGPTTQVGRSPYRRRQTVHPTPGACRARRREPCQSKRTAPSPQIDRGPRGPQAENPPAPGEAGATRNVVKRQARGAPRQSPAHRERGRGTRHARAATPGQPAGARNRGRGPLHGTGEPGGEATSGGPFITTRSDTQHKNGWPGGTEGLAWRREWSWRREARDGP
jgi:hypothetical protein